MSTTTGSPATDLAAFFAGFVTGEGCFTRRGSGFAFAVALGATDGETCVALCDFFGVGGVTRSRRRKPHYDDEVTFVVRRLRDLVDVIVPFMDAHLPPSHKRDQYETWRADLLAYWDTAAKRRRTCTTPGCDAPRRARGLCRRHYYLAYRR